ncbi:MAG: hypothetical protein LDL30_11440 [Desulfovibrio sp.]|nr:hypothetical protein [Desulfovibrio sp.]MCA1985818.1 hypothetical protein [Desulfovibrio sp.]
MTMRSWSARLAMVFGIVMLLGASPATGNWAVSCPQGYIKSPQGQCIKPGSGGQQQGQQQMQQGQQGRQQQGQQQMQQGQQGRQQQGKSAGCSQAYSNCNAVCAQSYAGHRNPAAYNACLTNCNMGYNTCR